MRHSNYCAHRAPAVLDQSQGMLSGIQSLWAEVGLVHPIAGRQSRGAGMQMLVGIGQSLP